MSDFDRCWRDWAEAIDAPKPKLPWWAQLMGNYVSRPSIEMLRQQAQCSPEQQAWLQTHPTGYSSLFNSLLGGLGGLGASNAHNPFA